MFKVLFAPKFKRVFKKLDPAIQQFIIDEISELATEPFLHPQVKKINGAKSGFYRMRIGRWRVIYFVIKKDRVIDVVDLFIKKSDADYRKRF